MAGDLRAEEEGIRPTFPIFERGEDVEETFALNTFGIVHMEVSSPFAIVFGGVWWRPVRGKYRQALEYRKFYEALGRPDLADRQESQHFWSSVMVWGGLAMEVGGGILFFTGLSGGEFTTQSKIGLGLFAGGVVSMAVGASTDDTAISEEEASALSQAYNAGLHEHLGLGALPSARRLATRRRFAFTPALGRDFRGLSVKLAF